jgi:L-threonylcarbamoyladenylate synthase
VDIVEQAVAGICAGRPVVLPTDTVYGLCASPYREEAVAELYRLKDRPATIACALLCADVDTLVERVPELRGRTEAQVRELLPGPYTLVLPNPERRFRSLNGPTLYTIGVRVPVLAGAAKEIVQRIGALASTSANRHNGIDPRLVEDVPAEIREACGAVVDGGRLPGVASTVLDLTGREPRVLREGAGSVADAFARLSALAA